MYASCPATADVPLATAATVDTAMFGSLASDWFSPRWSADYTLALQKRPLGRECLKNLQHAVLEVRSGAEGQYELA